MIVNFFLIAAVDFVAVAVAVIVVVAVVLLVFHGEYWRLVLQRGRKNLQLPQCSTQEEETVCTQSLLHVQ